MVACGLEFFFVSGDKALPGSSVKSRQRESSAARGPSLQSRDVT